MVDHAEAVAKARTLVAPGRRIFLVKIDHDDCPGLATVLDTIDRAGIGRSFDLKFWLQAWRRA